MTRARRQVNDAETLRAILGAPGERAANKERARLHEMDRRFIAHSRFLLMATSDADGCCDISPKGDPAGFVHFIDETHLAIPERPGNRRADSFHNVLDNPNVGLIFIVAGRNDTLRIRGRASLLSSAPYFDAMAVNGHQPKLALEVEIERLYYHCAKAFLRSELWSPSSWTPDAVPSRAHIVKEIEAPTMTLKELQAYYGPAYAKGLYRERGES